MSSQASGFSYSINGAASSLSDLNPTPQQILVNSGFEPAEDYTLISVEPHGTRILTADDVLTSQGASNELYAFEGGEAFCVTVNQHSIWWGSDVIDIALLRRFAHVRDGDDLVSLNVPGPNEVLPTQGNFKLGAPGMEHLKTHPRTQPHVEYHYFVGHDKFTTFSEELTGAQIIAQIPGWNPENSLVLESEGSGPDEVIRATTVVSFKNRHGVAHFSIVPPATFGAA